MTIEAIVHDMSCGRISQQQAVDALHREREQDAADRRLIVAAILLAGRLATGHYAADGVAAAVSRANELIDACKPR